MLGAILGLLLSGLIIGALARFALPGKDPMPIWATILLGIAGSLLGRCRRGRPRRATRTTRRRIFLGALLGRDASSSILYRRFVQKRPLTGPGAR